MPIIDKCVIRFANHNWSIAEKTDMSLLSEQHVYEWQFGALNSQVDHQK